MGNVNTYFLNPTEESPWKRLIHWSPYKLITKTQTLTKPGVNVVNPYANRNVLKTRVLLMLLMFWGNYSCRNALFFLQE